MARISDEFYVWAHFRRILPDGSVSGSRPRRALAVRRLQMRCQPGGKRYGTLFFADGSRTEEFPIDYGRPSYLARTAINFGRWCRGRR